MRRALALVLGEEQVAALAEPDVDADLLREAAAQLDRLLHEPDVLLGRPLHAHAAAVAPRGALREVAALEHDDVVDAALGELIGDAEAHDAAADDGDRRTSFLGGPCGRDDLRHAPPASFVRPPCARRCASGAGCTGGREVNGSTTVSSPPWAIAHRRAGVHHALLAFARAGAEAGVALDLLDRLVAERDGVLHVGERDVLAAADREPWCSCRSAALRHAVAREAGDDGAPAARARRDRRRRCRRSR